MDDITNSALYDHVFTNKDKFITAMCIEHACANMGMDHILDEEDTVEGVKQQLMENFYSAFLGEFGYSPKGEARAERKADESVNGEIKSFRAIASGDFDKIVERGLPWTLRSSRIVFESK